MDETDKAQQNMISNLPLLFANGYPTSLEKISESQLENFIPFMVQCSLGHINLPKKIDCSEPEWWPENAPFGIPLKKPKNFNGDWMEKMKEIVVICYQFHKSLFLLRFCNDLAAYEHASLRFMNNYNSTTSLYDRRNNKLLVTFRNENMSYDRHQKNRKCLLSHKSKTDIPDESQYMMVEPPPFDIYLCDNCDAELYSKEAILEHEKICNIEDDVILCDSPEPDNKQDNKNYIEQQNAFLQNFCLRTKQSDCDSVKVTQDGAVASNADEPMAVTSTKNKRISARRNRAVPSLNRCSFIPISSPAGQKLLKTMKQTTTLDYIFERQERMDRFCYTPISVKSSYRCKMFEKRMTSSNVHITFKKMQETSSHIYTFPRRQFQQRRDITQNFLFLNSPLIKQCRPISVRLKKLGDNIGEQFPATNSKLNIRLTRDASLNSQWRISPSTEVLVDTIDLCSSDDEDQVTTATTTTAIITPSSSSSAAAATASTTTNALAAITTPSKMRKSDTYAIIALSHKKDAVAQLNGYVETECASLTGYVQAAATATGAATTDDNSLRPLQQSVYIFSNYKTNSVLNRFSLPSTKSNSSDKALMQQHPSSRTFAQHTANNQENCDLPKKLVTEWCAVHPHPPTSSERKDINQTVETLTLENLSAVQPSYPPSRIISIDLTT